MSRDSCRVRARLMFASYGSKALFIHTHTLHTTYKGDSGKAAASSVALFLRSLGTAQEALHAPLLLPTMSAGPSRHATATVPAPASEALVSRALASAGLTTSGGGRRDRDSRMQVNDDGFTTVGAGRRGAGGGRRGGANGHQVGRTRHAVVFVGVLQGEDGRSMVLSCYDRGP